MKTREQLAYEEALIRERILSNTEAARGTPSSNNPELPFDSKNIFLNEAIANTLNEILVFPETPKIVNIPAPQEAPGKVWPTGILPYLTARIRVLFDGDLSMKSRLRLLPIFGYCFGWLNALLRLPLTRYRHTVAIDVLRQQNQLLREQLIALNQRVSQLEPCLNLFQAKQNLVINRLEQLEVVKASSRLHQLDNLDIGNRLMKLEQLEVARKIKQFTQLVKSNQLDTSENERIFAQISRRLDVLEVRDDRLKPSETVVQPGQTLDKAIDANLEDFYLDFEKQFRGSRAEIKQRQKVYLSYFDSLLEQPEDQRKLFVDVGCGRGEWLELLSEKGIPAIGIDSNAKMVDACLHNGYAAKVADGIEYLRKQDRCSLSGVSGFHIIEHLSFEKLIALFDAAYQALSEGGILIFETPNPENLIIGACNFYYDPTHLKPIVPDVAQFIAKQRGFRHVEIKRLHPFPDDYQMSGDSQLAQTVNKFLFSAQDYAVIARK